MATRGLSPGSRFPPLRRDGLVHALGPNLLGQQGLLSADLQTMLLSARPPPKDCGRLPAGGIFAQSARTQPSLMTLRCLGFRAADDTLEVAVLFLALTAFRLPLKNAVPRAEVAVFGQMQAQPSLMGLRGRPPRSLQTRAVMYHI